MSVSSIKIAPSSSKLGSNLAFYISCLVFFTLVFLAIFAKEVAPFNPLEDNLMDINLPPSHTHILGCDFLGRDLFSLILYALRISLIVGFFSAFFTIVITCLYALGSLIKPLSPLLDMLLDIFLALPSLLVIMFALTLFGGSIASMVLIIALAHWPFCARTVIEEFKGIRRSDFYIASIASGATPFRAFIHDVLPALGSLLLVLFIINFAHAIGMEALLSFFGLGVDAPSFGNILNNGINALLSDAWHIIAFPCVAIFLLIVSLFGISLHVQEYFGIRL